MAIAPSQHEFMIPPSGLNFEEFIDWLDEDGRAEWVDGEIVMTSPASKRHQEIMNFLTTLLRSFAEEKDLGTVLSAPFVMKLPRTAREPDVLFVSREREDQFQDTYLDGPADLVVEIISPESRGRDRHDKFEEYEQAGVKEYWIIDPENESTDFYVLEDSEFKEVELEDHIFSSRMLKGLEIDVNWLWKDPLPKTTETLNELNLL